MRVLEWRKYLKKQLIELLSKAQVSFVRRLFSDSTLGLGEEEHTLIKLCQVNPSRSVYADRFWEWRSFYGISRLGAIRWFVMNGWPFSRQMHHSLMAKFDGNTSGKNLFQTYDSTSLHYSAELMLSMHRVQWIWRFIPDIKSVIDLSKCQVLEYGCGVSDLGLLMARLGASVTIVDLLNRKLSFAIWRYQTRGLKVNNIGVLDTDSVPGLEAEQYDIVFATEILEHVHDPLLLLQALTESLRMGGLLFSSMGLSFEREIGGDHLPEAVAIGQSKEYESYFHQHYKLLATREEHPWLFIRVR